MSYLAIILCLLALNFMALGLLWHTGNRDLYEESEIEKLIQAGIEGRTRQLKYQAKREKGFQEKWNSLISKQGGSDG